MKRFAAIAALALLAACGDAGNASSSGSVFGDSPDVVASKKAHDAATQLLALAKGSASSGVLPTSMDPKGGPLLNTLFDASALPKTTPAFNDIDPETNWLHDVNQVGDAYLLAGTGATEASNLTTDQEVRVAHNLSLYGAELGRYFDMALALLAIESASTADYLKDNPGAASSGEAADGLTKIRDGVAATADGLLGTIGAGSVTSRQWNEARAKSLASFAPSAARILSAQQRAELATKAKTVEDGTDDATMKASLDLFIAAISPAPAPTT